MRASAPRMLARTLARPFLAPPPSAPLSTSAAANSAAAAAGAPACPGTSSKTVPQKGAPLPPVRYHIFQTPLPYPAGLELQQRVIEGRLKRRGEGGSSAQDVMFLLGKC